MSSTPPGWYPDPSGRQGQRYFDGSRWTEHANDSAGGFAPAPQGRRGVPNWVWAVVAITLSSIVAIAVGVVVFKSGPPMPNDSDASTTSSAPVRSATFPQLQLPAGTSQRDYQSYEHFDVPLDYSETVEAVRPQLPIGRTYDGLAWCAEAHTEADSTKWSWGNESDYLTVWVYPASQSEGSEIHIAREPNPTGCLP